MANFKHLTSLDLGNTYRSGSMAADVDLSGSIKTLKHLDLGYWTGSYSSDTQAYTNPGNPKWLANYSLVTLKLVRAKFDFDMANLDLSGSKDTLTTLNFEDNEGFIPGPVPKWLRTFTNLASLNLKNTNRNGLLSHVGKILSASAKTLKSCILSYNTGFVPGKEQWSRS